MSWEAVCRGAGVEVHEPHEWVLRAACYQEMGGDGGEGVVIDYGIELEGRGGLESVGGVDLEGVVVGG